MPLIAQQDGAAECGQSNRIYHGLILHKFSVAEWFCLNRFHRPRSPLDDEQSPAQYHHVFG
ncbi:Uncharacterised protein [Vibrio cholerae]|nr:Uncharacterised protein [Vibrio cholerae]